jgi:hypothetical protein
MSRIAHRRPGAGAARRSGFRGAGGGGPAPAAWTPASLAATQHWYEGDDVTLATTKITTFNDKDGADDLTQATDANRPVYSASIATLGNEPGGVFTRASSHWVGGAFAAVSQPFTIVLAWSYSAVGVQQAVAGSNVGAQWYIRSSAANSLVFYGGTTPASTSLTVAANTLYRGFFVFNGTSSKVRVNGASVYAGATNLGASTCSTLALGRWATIEYLDGSIAHAAVLSGDLIADAASLALYETYLAKYA